MKISSAEVTPVPMLDGVQRRTLVCGDRMMMVHFTIRKEAEVPLHQHPHEQAGYLLQGELEMNIGGQTFRLRPGDSYLAPANVEHSARVLQDSIVVDVFSPPREDYK